MPVFWVPCCEVSVPLPGFSGLRPAETSFPPTKYWGFSPVAGIQWVETTREPGGTPFGTEGFSPVAGIQWVETLLP